MARTVETERNTILGAAIDIIDGQGADALSARAVAERLGISTQPIYREFGDMDGLKRAAVGRGFEAFSEYIAGEALDQSMRYVTFAGEHPRLFEFLFRGRHISYSGLNDLSHKLMKDTDIIDRLTEITGLPREKVYRVHLFLWMALHGLAVMSADNGVALESDEIAAFTKDMTRALGAYYKENEL